MNSLTSATFWKATAERAVAVFAYTLVTLIGYGAVAINHIDWITDLGISATATIVSVLHAVASTSPIVPVAPAADPASVPVAQLQTYADPASAR